MNLFFSIWAPFQYPWGRTEGSGPPTPRVQPPTPAHSFPSYPAPCFFFIFLPGTPPKIKIFFLLRPHPIFRQKPPYPHPLNSLRPSDAYICVSKLAIIASDNGLSPGRRQAIIETNDRILLIWSLGTNFSEILIKIHSFSFKKMHLKMSSGKWRPFCLGLNVLTPRPSVLPHVSDKTSYHKKLWSLEDMRLVMCIIHHTTAEVPAPFQSDRTILNTNLAASKNLRDLTIRRLLRCFNIR